MREVPLTVVIMNAMFPTLKEIAETSFVPVIHYRFYWFPGQLTGKEMRRSICAFCPPFEIFTVQYKRKLRRKSDSFRDCFHLFNPE
jgi:hypothetical protein